MINYEIEYILRPMSAPVKKIGPPRLRTARRAKSTNIRSKGVSLAGARVPSGVRSGSAADAAPDTPPPEQVEQYQQQRGRSTSR